MPPSDPQTNQSESEVWKALNLHGIAKNNTDLFALAPDTENIHPLVSKPDSILVLDKTRGRKRKAQDSGVFTQTTMMATQANHAKRRKPRTPDDEPNTIPEAISLPDSDHWRKSIKEEIDSLISRKTWEFATPENKRTTVGS